MAYRRTSNPIAKAWMNRAVDISEGDQIIIPFANKEDAKSLKWFLYNERKLIEDISPDIAATITISLRVMEDKFCLVIGKLHNKAQSLGIIIHKDGSTSHIDVSLTKDTARQRMMDMMIEDGKEVDSIMNIVKDLTDDEISYIRSKTMPKMG